MKKGDTIKCHDINDLVNTMQNLAMVDIETDFVYEKDGEKGYWLVVTKAPKEEYS